MQDFAQPNILMRFCFKDNENSLKRNEQIMFVYSNLNGLEHMKQVLKDNPLFSNLLTPKEIFKKLSDVISYNFFGNNLTGVVSTEWAGRNISVTKKEEDYFFKAFDTWIVQLENLVGKENLLKVSISKDEVDKFDDLPSDIEQNIYFMKTIETYRLKSHLTTSLADKPYSKSKKI